MLVSTPDHKQRKRMGRQAFLLCVFIAGLFIGVTGLLDAFDAVLGFIEDHLEQKICHWPAYIDGQWDTSLWGNITVTGKEVDTNLNFGGTAADDFECYPSSDSRDTVLRSKKTLHQDGQSFELFTCLELIPRNKHNYQIIVKTGKDTGLRNEPLKRRAVQDKSNETSAFSSCNKDLSTRLHGDMIRKGKAESAAVLCPSALIGNFSVTFGDKAEMSQCPYDAVMTSDASNRSIMFDYTHCTHGNSPEKKVLGTEIFWCIGNSAAGISLYQESGDIGSFSCVTVRPNSDNNGVLIYTQTPGNCGQGWVVDSDTSDETQLKIAFLTPINNNQESPIVETTPLPELLTLNKEINNNTGDSSVTISNLDKVQGEENNVDFNKSTTFSWKFQIASKNITEKQDFNEDGARHLVPCGLVLILSLAICAFSV
ncbi:hypothetical protein RRG08_010662 [Elysia crispata]|uniref:Uncharacterized protein n=1 Tax=Elysia crispata TaxID=231223 RepID=A0AAE0Z0P9_9GAST|nr:hypothetical protein RRG08_010662 [Elysia crispata]